MAKQEIGPFQMSRTRQRESQMQDMQDEGYPIAQSPRRQSHPPAHSYKNRLTCTLLHAVASRTRSAEKHSPTYDPPSRSQDLKQGYRPERMRIKTGRDAHKPDERLDRARISRVLA